MVDISRNLCFLQDRPQVITDDRIIASRIRIATMCEEEEIVHEDGHIDNDDTAAVFDTSCGLHRDEDIKACLSQLTENPDLYYKPGIFEGVGVQIQRVPSTDPRRELRGQWGLYATHSIPRFTIIAPYSGWLRSTHDDGANSSSEKLPEGDSANEYVLHIAQFKVRELSGRDSAGNDGGLAVTSEDGDLEIQAFPNKGNETMYINDSRGIGNGNKEIDRQRRNCAFVQVLHDDWPYMFVCSTRDIMPGDELLVSYGDSFWNDGKKRQLSVSQLLGLLFSNGAVMLTIFGLPLLLIFVVLVIRHSIVYLTSSITENPLAR